MTVAPPPVTMLFVPGNADDKLAKIPGIRSRAFILDLEDAVPPPQKPVGRERVAQTLADLGDRHALHVRVNPVGSPHLADDLEAAVRPGLTGIVVPKVTRATDLVTVDALISRLERRAGLPVGSVELMATIETVAGMRAVDEIAVAGAAGRLRRLCFGAGDFTLDLGLDWPDNEAGSSPTLLYAKSQLVLASRAAGLEPPHDGVYPRYRDLDSLAREARESKRLGFVGKHAIHPDQLPIIEETYRPSDAQVERARRIVEEFERAEASGRGAVGVDGMLVDYPVLYRARQVLAEAGA